MTSAMPAISTPEPAFVLHTRPYRETSLLVDVFTRHYGRFRVVARGARSSGGIKKKTQTLTPYMPLLISWVGNSNLKTLRSVESSGSPLVLTGNYLYCGFYLNELLLRLLAEYDPHAAIFDHYLVALTQLSMSAEMALTLRQFEFTLLDSIGYAVVLDIDAVNGEAIQPDNWYWFEPMEGFIPRARDNSHFFNGLNWFQGKDLKAIHSENYQQPSTVNAAKRLIRLALQPHIGDLPLNSRKLFKRAN